MAYVTSGQSDIAERFCYLAISGVVNELRNTQRPVDMYPIVNDDGHVFHDEIVKLLTDEIGIRYASQYYASYTSSSSLSSFV